MVVFLLWIKYRKFRYVYKLSLCLVEKRLAPCLRLQIGKEQQLYDLKAIPTLYLLNKDKTVLLKDAPAQTIEEYLLMKGEQ